MSEVTAEMIERGRRADPVVSAKRRRVANDVRATRERLTSAGSGHRTFDVALLTMYVDSRKNAAFSQIILGLTIACMASIWGPLQLVGLWYLSVLGCLLFNLLMG